MMNQQTNQEINESLAELQAVVDLYHPERVYYDAAIMLAICIIIVIVICAIGWFFGLLILGIGFIPIVYKVLTSPNHSPTEKELSESACILMSSCISRYKNPESKIHILSYNSYFGGNNLSLYKEFISIFPQMASKKLKKLASVNLGR